MYVNQKLERRRKNKETKDEIFIWENSNNQRNVKDVIDFLKKHIIDYDSSEDVETEIEKSIKENKLLIEKLSR